MSYCLNPHCKSPQNPQGANYCQTCGNSLILKQHYQAIKKIGQGGFGRTFLSIDRSQGNPRRCAIKQLSFESKNPDMQRKATDLFEQEAQRLYQLGNHPQIPQFYNYFHEGDNHYLVQEYRPGENLDVILEQTGKWTEPQIRDLLKKLLPVLNYIHDRQVIHRDIKPANIIQGLNGEYSLVDFGSAKYVTETALLNTGTTIGSPEFVAPEQLRGKAIYASDLYGLGVTCLYLLTQVSPFLLFDSAEGVWVWREYLGDTQMSDKLGAILDRLIQLGTKHRYRCARDVFHALKPAKKLPPPPPPRPRFFPPSGTKIWRCVQTLEGHRGSVCALAMSPDGQLLASGSFDSGIKIWNLETGSLEETLNLHTNPVLTLAFSPLEHQLASGSIDDVIKIWDFGTATVYCTPLEHYGSSVTLSLAYHPQGKAIASGGDDRQLQIWLTESDRHLSIPHPRGINTVAFSPDGKLIASGSSDNQIYLWHVETGEPITQLKGHQRDINAIAFSRDGHLASGSSDLTVKLWNLSSLHTTPLPQHTFQPSSDWVRAVAFSSDSQQLMAGSADGSLTIWDLQMLQIRQTLREHFKDINAIAISPGRSLMATASRDTTIKIWIGD
ncbi:WD40 repeat domain-containing serine/threonine-protein kinase [Roseofilum capinflatum]|uniref:WD40 repeat domain-containing serine/threonine-protein kinase n=1 Tax=Roseofilum capinflatum BLCC-M114 TaxID=3022440 RepID=A0ABT7BAZ7_9CYAN|nr:WD40 repeat domain-containing serine/threonine-protein kinase [Roseofilum capinflatum]MDJ1176311.1 WD40 repeat domain-containing serine/threonine-protein kinase [Roseofilum capinflatum BLCC-M114]